MNNGLTGYWNKTKVKLKQRYPIITEEDLLFREGKEKEMIEMLGYKLGKTKCVNDVTFSQSCLLSPHKQNLIFIF